MRPHELLATPTSHLNQEGSNEIRHMIFSKLSDLTLGRRAMILLRLDPSDRYKGRSRSCYSINNPLTQHNLLLAISHNDNQWKLQDPQCLVQYSVRRPD